ncbi:MAG TPA: hypothetical protein VD926_10895 [Acidimicrobiales bacterium]|nr:hypothetical protein [Acidimicrobiales bacterium]
MSENNWFVGCGSCDGKAWVKNAAIVRDTSCDACKDYGSDERTGVYVLDSLVCTELGWCTCGNPEDVDRMMLAYLTARSYDDFPKPRAEGVSEDAEMLLAYIADALGWTEHGGSVGGAWLTDDGREAMANLARRPVVV